MCLFELQFSQGLCPVVGLLSHTVVLCLVYKGTSILFSTLDMSVYTPTNSVGGFPFLYTTSSMYCVWMSG